MEIFRDRPTWETDLTEQNEKEKHQEIQKSAETDKMDENSLCMAYISIELGGQEAQMDEISKSDKISQDIGLVHYKEIHRNLLLLYCPYYLHINSLRH